MGRRVDNRSPADRLANAAFVIEGLQRDLDAANAALAEAVRERDARLRLVDVPTEFVAGEWIMSGQAEPDAVVTYASEPSPETGHVGWCWWARGRMGDARSYMDAREAAEAALRDHGRKADR